MDDIQLGLHYLSVFKDSSNEGMYKGDMYDISLHTAGVVARADPKWLQVENLQATSGSRKPCEKPILDHLKSSRKNENKPDDLLQAIYGTSSHMLHPTVDSPPPPNDLLNPRRLSFLQNGELRHRDPERVSRKSHYIAN